MGGKFFSNRWWVVVASVCGLLVGTGAINTFAFAVFKRRLGLACLGSGRSKSLPAAKPRL